MISGEGSMAVRLVSEFLARRSGLASMALASPAARRLALYANSARQPGRTQSDRRHRSGGLPGLSRSTDG
jgi:hypothetical protein